MAHFFFTQTPPAASLITVVSHLPVPQSASSQQYAPQVPSGRQVWPASQNGPSWLSHASQTGVSLSGGKQPKPVAV
jgi:hypothetical protein